MRNYKQVLIGILISSLIVGVVDVILVIKNIPTISETILYYSFNKKIIVAPYFIGILVGHFFIPSNLNILKRWYIKFILLVILAIILQLINFIIFIHPLIHVFIGIVSGCLFWNQNKIFKEK